MRKATVGQSATARAVREALGAFASPVMRDEMLALALSVANTGEVPDDIEALQRFLDGPLRTVVSGYLGEDAADAVAADLAPMVAVLTSQVRPKRETPVDEITGVRCTPTPIPRVVAPIVLLASMNGSRFRALAKGLEGIAVVRVAEHVFALAAGLDGHTGRLPLVVVDLAAAPFDSACLCALAPLLPIGTRVVLWGDATRFERSIERLRRGGIDFVSCGAEVTSREVAELCRMFIGR